MKQFILVIILITITPLAFGQSNQSYLRHVFSKVNEITSASYYATIESWAPGDTAASHIHHYYFKEFRNIGDTTIGSSFAKLLAEDTTKAAYCYDGLIGASIDWKRNQMQIDSFLNNSLPFRPIQAPFFNYVTSILRYALETGDPIGIKVNDIGGTMLITLTIKGSKQVEFFGKPFYIDSPYSENETSKYQLWFNKTDGLPYRVRREMPHDISDISCKGIIANQVDHDKFLISDYLPAEFAINEGRPISHYNTLIGKSAPDWALRSGNNEVIALGEVKSKVILIQFTSVSCGPCRLSASFLKNLITKYKQHDLSVISIETFNRNSMALETYRRKNSIPYPFLLSTDEVTKNYQVELVPTFFLLDSDRIVRKVITGYRKGAGDEEITATINELLMR